MKLFFSGIAFLLFSILMGCLSSAWASTQAYLTTPISVAVVSAEDKADFEARIAPVLKEQMKSCSSCSFQNITPYTAEGKFNLSELAARLDAAGSSSSFIFINWNGKATDETKTIIESLKKITGKGMIVVAAAGLAKENEPTLALNKTVLGQVPGVVIIGELGDRERMLTQSYFGPEMLTALRPPTEYMGQGIGPLFFVSRLATQWSRKDSKEWIAHFQTTKAKVRRIWPALEDFFRR